MSTKMTGWLRIGCTLFLYLFMAETAMAADMPWDSMLSKIVSTITGTTGKTITTLIIIGAGLGFYLGKVPKSLLIGIVAGAVLIFGSAAIMEYFVAGSGPAVS